MYRDMTRGSITPGAAAVCPAMAAGGPVWRWPMRWRGRWASTASGPLSLSAGFWRTPWDTATTSSGAERCSLGGETADSRNQKSGASPMNCTPFVGRYGILSSKMNNVLYAKGEYHRIKLKTKRPEPCAVQDPDRSGRLFLFLSNFLGSLPCGCGSFIILLLQGFSLHVFKGRFSSRFPIVLVQLLFAAPGSTWPYQWALP